MSMCPNCPAELDNGVCPNCGYDLVFDAARSQPEPVRVERLVRRLSLPQRSVWSFMVEDGRWFCSAGGKLSADDNYPRLPGWFRGQPIVTLRAMHRKGAVERKIVEFGTAGEAVRWAVYRAIKPPNFADQRAAGGARE